MTTAKKYIQITVFLSLFGILILIKNYIGHSDDDEVSAVIAPNIPTPTTSVTPTASAVPTNVSATNSPVKTVSPTPTPNSGLYTDGTFTGSVEDAYYGNLQVQAVVTGGRITDVIFLQYPNDNRTSLRINSQSNGYLKAEAISAQSANIDIVSGASDSSFAFRKSMATALAKARK